MKRTTPRAGFSILEALIALAIAAVGLQAIFALQHQLSDGQRRTALVERRVEAKRNALAVISQINPTLQPFGILPLPPHGDVRWTAEPLSGSHLNAGLPLGYGAFEVRLYRLAVSVTDRDVKTATTFNVEQLGWRRVRPADQLLETRDSAKPAAPS